MKYALETDKKGLMVLHVYAEIKADNMSILEITSDLMSDKKKKRKEDEGEGEVRQKRAYIKNKVKCPDCGKIAKGKMGLAVHRVKSPKCTTREPEEENEKRNKVCPICGKSYVGQTGLNIHMGRMHLVGTVHLGSDKKKEGGYLDMNDSIAKEGITVIK